MERLTKEELDTYLGKEEAKDYYKDLEKFNQYKFMWFTFNWRPLIFMPLWLIERRVWGVYIASYFLMLCIVLYAPVRNEVLFLVGNPFWNTIVLILFILSILFSLFGLLFGVHEEIVRTAFKKIYHEGVTKRKKTTKKELWGWSLFFYFPLILSLSFKVPTFFAELTKPFDQQSHDAFEKALKELERPNPLQVLATGYLNSEKIVKPKPKGYEEYLDIEYDDNFFEERTEAQKDKRHDHHMQKGVKRKFVDNKDGTITDESLGLMWQDTKDVASVKYKVDRIENVCKYRRVIGGYDDWKVPSTYELKSLMNFNEDKIPNNIFKYGYNLKYSSFWSATDSKDKEDNGRMVCSLDYKPGCSALGKKTTNKRKELLRCVRRLKKQKPIRKFDFIEDVNRQVILDRGTSLMWQNEPYSYEAAKTGYRDYRKYQIEKGKRMSQKHALEYCDELELGGYSDWYVPNINQLDEIGITPNWRILGDKEYLHPFTRVPAVWDEEEYYPPVHNSTHFTDEIHFVRCVRDAKVWKWEDEK